MILKNKNKVNKHEEVSIQLQLLQTRPYRYVRQRLHIKLLAKKVNLEKKAVCIYIEFIETRILWEREYENRNTKSNDMKIKVFKCKVVT